MGTTPLMKTIVILLACVAADKFELDMPRQGSRAPELCSEFISNPAAKTFIWATHRELMDYAETTPGLEVVVKITDYDLLVRGLAASYATAFGNMTHDDPSPETLLEALMTGCCLMVSFCGEGWGEPTIQNRISRYGTIYNNIEYVEQHQQHGGYRFTGGRIPHLLAWVLIDSPREMVSDPCSERVPYAWFSPPWTR